MSTKPRRLRKRALLALLVAVAGACAVTAANNEIRWRLAVIKMKANGEVPSLSWGELLGNLRPHSGVYLRPLASIPNPDVAITNPYASPQDSIAGAEAFRRRCSSCHGLDARGGAVGPSLTSNGPLLTRRDWELYRIIEHGIPGTAMRAYDLPSETIWQLVAYLQSRRSTESVRPSGQPINVPFSKLLNATADSSGWYTYSGNYGSHRFSALSSINRRNVRGLRVAWQYQSSATESKFESSPLVIDGVIYFTEPPGNIVAVDASDGAVRWRYVRPVPNGLSLCCGAVNRGLAVLDSLLYVGTLDAHLIALDARNGSVVWDREVADWHNGYSITGAPLAIGQKVVTGVAGGEFGTRGFLAAFDAATGNQIWRFWTVPEPGEPGSDSWTGDAWKHGGAPTWLTGSYDRKLNLLYWGVGNPAPNFNGDDRAGTNLYSNSVIALDADSGTLRWHYQFTPHDEHDWDAVQIPVLIDATYQGVSRSLIAWANRNAFYYLLDRETGKFLLARPFARQSWAENIDSTGMVHARPTARPSSKGTLVYPGVGGATNWWSPSYSPQTGLLYVPVVEASSIVFSERERYQRGEMYLGGVSQEPNEINLLVRALAPLTGQLVWQHSFDTKTSTKRAGVGGVLSVAGGLVFVGIERTFYALDAQTGAELWRFNTGGQIAAAPITYASHGRQYVAIAAGRALIAFELDEPERD